MQYVVGGVVRPHLAADGTAIVVAHGPDNHLKKFRKPFQCLTYG
jgi:hypothetical protein